MFSVWTGSVPLKTEVKRSKFEVEGSWLLPAAKFAIILSSFFKIPKILGNSWIATGCVPISDVPVELDFKTGFGVACNDDETSSGLGLGLVARDDDGVSSPQEPVNKPPGTLLGVWPVFFLVSVPYCWSDVEWRPSSMSDSARSDEGKPVKLLVHFRKFLMFF